MTQRERGLEILTTRAPRLLVLGELLAEAQNEPPLGESDGSLSVPEWDALRRYHRTLREMGDAKNLALHLFKGAPDVVVFNDPKDFQ